MTNDEIVKHAVANSRDRRTHRWLQVTRIAMVVGLLVLGVLVALLYLRGEERDKNALSLVQQIQAECDAGKAEGAICDRADKVEKDIESDSVPVPGAPGKDGADGRDGTDGQDGKPGRDGKPGADGKDGTSGVNGLDGTAGMSAYQVAVANGYTGSEADWLASLRAVDGKDGAQGQKGDPGEPGADAWPFEFQFTFTTRAGRTYDCQVSIGEDGQQQGSTACTPREGAPDVQPTE